MTSLFPDDLADPWSDSASLPKVDSAGSIGISTPSATEPPPPEEALFHRGNIDNVDNNAGSGYLDDLINQNEDLLKLARKIKHATIPATYTELYNKNIRPDGLVDFLSVEPIFELAGLNQISIDNILNLVTLNETLDFTTVNRELWNVVLGLVALEQHKLGGGNFQNLELNLERLPDVVLEKPISDGTTTAATAAISGSIWSDDPTLSPILSPPNNSASQHSTGTSLNNKAATSAAKSNSTVDDLHLRHIFNPNSKNLVSVAEIPEKEGIVFKHINYLVSHSISLSESDPANGRKVVRRYSDFVWLFEVLLKRYPFRMVPGLPPKRFSGGSSTDALFLQRRRRGLSRFLNIIMKHPILSKEPMLIMFLTIPTELSIWRKQTTVEIIEEFEGKRISKRFIDNWNENIQQVWLDAEKALPGIQNNWAKITLLVERFEKRKQLYNADNQKFVEVLNSFIADTNKIYPMDPSDIPTINVGIKSIATHVKTSASLLHDESQLIEDGILRDFKEFKEYLTSLYGVFERRARLGGNTIPEIKKRVEQNQAKLSQLKKKSDVKGSDIDSVVRMINSDKQVIIRQTNRDWLIKECIQQEFLLFQETQYKITKVFQEWVSDRLKYSELHSENWSQLLDSVQEMPLNTM